MCNKIGVSTRTFMSQYKCEGPNKSESLLLRKLARYFNKHEETGRTATVNVIYRFLALFLFWGTFLFGGFI